jgi:hypothetical protein
MTITLVILSVVFSVIAGISKAICDLSEEGKIKFYKKTFWIKDLSWQNKWKNGDKKQGEKFWLSSRQLVWITDAWHLFGVLFRTTFANTYICVGLLISINIWYAFASLVVYIIFATTFHIFYTYKIFRK